MNWYKQSNIFEDTNQKIWENYLNNNPQDAINVLMNNPEAFKTYFQKRTKNIATIEEEHNMHEIQKNIEKQLVIQIDDLIYQIGAILVSNHAINDRKTKLLSMETGLTPEEMQKNEELAHQQLLEAFKLLNQLRTKFFELSNKSQVIDSIIHHSKEKTIKAFKDYMAKNITELIHKLVFKCLYGGYPTELIDHINAMNEIKKSAMSIVHNLKNIIFNEWYYDESTKQWKIISKEEKEEEEN